MSLDLSTAIIDKQPALPTSLTKEQSRPQLESKKTLGFDVAGAVIGFKKIALFVWKIFFYLLSLFNCKKFYGNVSILSKDIECIRINCFRVFSFSSSRKKSSSQNEGLATQDEGLATQVEVPAVSLRIESPPIPPPNRLERVFTMFEGMFNERWGDAEKEYEIHSLDDLFKAQIDYLSKPHNRLFCLQNFRFFPYKKASTRYEDFQNEIATLSDEYILSYMPEIQTLIQKCAIKYNISSVRDEYPAEMQLFFTFSPFLLRFGLNETIARSIFSIIKLMPNFLVVIPIDLVKKCIQVCPELGADENAIFSIIHHKVSENLRDSDDQKLVNIDSDLFHLFLSLAKSKRNLRIMFFQLVTHSLIGNSEFDKKYCHELILKMIEPHPFLLTEIVPTSRVYQKEGKFIDLCLAVYAKQPFKSDLFYLPSGDLHHYTLVAYSSRSTELDKAFYGGLAVKAHECGATVTKKQAKVMEEVFPRGSAERRYFEEKGYFIKPIRVESDLKAWDPSRIRDVIVSRKRDLVQEMRLGNLSEKRINFKLVIDCHDVKKAVKEVIVEGRVSTESFLEEYKEFVTLYDRIIDHMPIFAFIRSMSKEFRDLIKHREKLASDELRKFILLVDSDIDHNSTYREIGELIPAYLATHKFFIRESRVKIAEIASAFF